MGEGNSKNHYELLGLPRDATADQVRDAYRELARVYHPDSNFYAEITGEKVSHDAVQTFKELTAAYNTLANAEKRKAYDATLPGPMADWNEGTSEGDVYRPKPRPDVRTWGVFGVVQQQELREEPPEQAPSLLRRVLGAFGL